MKLSFCITCMGRLEYLKSTLAVNTTFLEDFDNIEFTILAYGDKETENYLLENYKDLITKGKIIVGFFHAEYFNLPHAKNLAYRISTGDVLCNLDADVFLTKEYINFIKFTFIKNKDRESFFIKRQWQPNHEKKQKGLERRGLAGRLAIRRIDFFKIRGYCEDFTGWGIDDVEIEIRLKNNGFSIIDIPYDILGPAIRHTDEVRLKNHNLASRNKINSILENGILNTTSYCELINVKDANLNGNWGCGSIILNGTSQMELFPM